MMFIRQGATHKVVLGPFVDVGDGFTPETAVALSSADEAEAILHDNGTVVDISAYTWAAITTADGYYHLTLQSGISGTVGHLTIVVQDDSVCLPVKAEFTVVEEAVYDAMFASAAAMDVNIASTDDIDLSATQKASVNTEVDNAIVTYKLDHLVAAAESDDPVDNSIIAKMAASDGDWSGFANTTDSLEAIRDKQTDIETDTAEIGAAGAGLTDLGGMSTSMKAEVNTEADTAISDAALSTAANLATVDTVVDAIKVITDALGATAAARLALTMGASPTGTVDNTSFTPTTTQFEADDITEATADHYIGRIILFTSGVLNEQATDITDYSLQGSNGRFRVTSLTEAPGNDDTFIII